MDNISDQKIRKAVFWIVLAIAAGVVASGFIAERMLSYSLLRHSWIRFGYTGFQFAKIPTSKEAGGQKRIIMLGNSVYQYNNIPQYMQKIADKDKSRLVFLNMAQVSSTIYDYLAHTAKVVGSKPDLVVFCMNEGTFSFDPKFKTDSDQFVFDKDVLKVMPRAFYFRYFTYQTAVDSIFSTLIPLKRVDPVIRWKFRLRDWVPEWFLRWVSYPYLNVALGGNVKTIQMTQLARSSGNEKFIVLQEILDILQKNNTRALFIWQQAKYIRSPSEDENAARALEYRRIRKYIESRDNTFFVDMSSLWDKGIFSDTIHPKGLYAADYARTHYDAVLNALAFFEDKDKRRQGP